MEVELEAVALEAASVVDLLEVESAELELEAVLATWAALEELEELEAALVVDTEVALEADTEVATEDQADTADPAPPAPHPTTAPPAPAAPTKQLSTAALLDPIKSNDYYWGSSGWLQQRHTLLAVFSYGYLLVALLALAAVPCSSARQAADSDD